MDQDQLRGYYALAERIVPSIERNAKIRINVKKHLVDRLVDYGAYKLGKKSSAKMSSKIVSISFLALIKFIGLILPEYTRANGEVY